MNFTDRIFLTVLFLFGVMTLMLSGSIIFDLFGIRAMERNYVDFVVWANLVASILYIATLIDFVRKKKWNWHYLAYSFVILVGTTIAFWIYIENGGIHEAKTVKAVIFRTVFTGILLSISFIKYKKRLKK